MNDIGIYPRTNDGEELVVKRLKDDEFRKLVQSLNIEQKEFFYHVLNSVRIGKLPLKLFLSGGAGVDKSTVTNALYEALIIYLNSQPQNNPDDVSVVKVAPTEDPLTFEEIHYTPLSKFLQTEDLVIVHLTETG